MTVDMLAATFFWPEGTLMGPQPPHDGGDGTDAPAERHDPTDEAVAAEPFWSAVMRHLWRPPATRPAAPAR